MSLGNNALALSFSRRPGTMASPKSYMVGDLVLRPLTVRGPSPGRHSDSEASRREQEGMRFMWQATSLHQSKPSRWDISLVPLSFLLHFGDFFFPSQIALHFLFDLISSTEKCCPEGPAEILSGPASLKKASSLFEHQEWKKCFLCFRD